MHSFLAENAVVRLGGCDVVDADGLYPLEGVVVCVVEVGEELEPL